MRKLLKADGLDAQPKGLIPLFFVELWERFGFYAIQAVLILYLTKVFHLSDTVGYDLFAITAAFMYASPFVGGYLADKVLGYRTSIILGAILLAFGYWALMIPGLHFFYWAIALIVIGNGFFKSCISTMVGLLYGENDPRRDSGFTIFYMGINIGSFTGPLMSGYVSTHWGWPATFAITGGGLVVAIVIALCTFRILGDKGLQPPLNKVNFLGGKYSPKSLVFLGTILAVFIFGWLVENHQLANVLFVAVCVACVLGVLVLALKCKGQDRNNMLILIILLIFSIIFWAIYNQTFSSLDLFTDRIVNRNLLGYEIPTAAFQAVNPFFIIALTPFFVKLWPYVDRTNHWLSSGAVKFAVALVIMGAAYFVLVAGIAAHSADGKVSMFWLNSSYFLQTVGELCLSPIGLSLASALAPEHYRGMMMGAWMLSISAGYSLGNYLSQFSSVPDNLVHNANILMIEHFYSHAFSIFMWLAFISGFVLWILSPMLNKMLSKHHKEQ